jgi:hypothetical protein
MDFLISSGKCAESLELLDKIFEGSKEEKEKLRAKMIVDASFYYLNNMEIENAFDYFSRTDSSFDVREILVYFDELKPKNYEPKRKFSGPIKEQCKRIQSKFRYPYLKKKRKNIIYGTCQKIGRRSQITFNFISLRKKKHKQKHKRTTSH